MHRSAMECWGTVDMTDDEWACSDNFKRNFVI